MKIVCKSNTMTMDKAGNVIIDIESLKHPPPDKRCCGSSKSLVRKSSCRMEKQEMEEPSKNLFVKVLPPLLDQLKPPLVQNKALIAVPSVLNSPISADSGDGRNRRFQRWKTIHPRKILLFFATILAVSSLIEELHRKSGSAHHAKKGVY
ncbi:uncharacterized protein LOC110020980 isoform X2 [Phalaenopsis equestris]|uniref:uncharacterized protein LOC110020980 isoform X2 n=1 Tax=Phalaenopsis equestris TaxID=78828 RepID=UPI0009E59100|nr:uncharacterized protein LOC110020980 isoform X2 [Phalaenopsis equestris]